MPAWLLWLCPVPLATFGAVLWTVWRSRPKGPREAIETVVAYERFRAALSAPQRTVPAQQRRVPATAGSSRS